MKWVDAPPLRLTACLFLALTTSAPANAGVARVIAVTDGDTVVLQEGGKRQERHLAGIDAPELAQPHGTQARRALGSRLLGHLVRVRSGKEGVVLELEGEDVAAALVREGHAWVTPSSRNAVLAPLQETAKRQRLGLWQGSAAIPPWKWRSGVRTLASHATRPAGLLIGDRRLQRYYPDGCSADVPASDRVLFRSVAVARRAGFRPAPECGRRNTR